MVVFNLNRDRMKLVTDKLSSVQSSRPDTIVNETTGLMICQ